MTKFDPKFIGIKLIFSSKKFAFVGELELVFAYYVDVQAHAFGVLE